MNRSLQLFDVEISRMQWSVKTLIDLRWEWGGCETWPWTTWSWNMAGVLNVHPHELARVLVGNASPLWRCFLPEIVFFSISIKQTHLCRLKCQFPTYMRQHCFINHVESFITASMLKAWLCLRLQSFSLYSQPTASFSATTACFLLNLGWMTVITACMEILRDHICLQIINGLKSLKLIFKSKFRKIRVVH